MIPGIDVAARLEELRLAAAAVPPDRIPDVLAEIARVEAVLWRRLMLLPPSGEPAEDAEGLLDIPEAARFLAVKKSQVAAMARRGELPTVRVGRYVRFRRIDLVAWVAENGLDNGIYSAYSQARDGPRSPAAPAAARPHAGRARGAPGRGGEYSRPLGAGRNADQRADGSAAPAAGTD